jgi:hypothetical protein
VDQNDPEGKAEWHRLYQPPGSGASGLRHPDGELPHSKAEAEHKTPAQIVGELVRKELKAAM